MNINGVAIEDTFAEAFPMTAARLIVTAETPAWARMAGYSSRFHRSTASGLC